MNKPKPQYKIKYDKVRDDYIIQIYYGSTIGWSYLTSKKTLEEARNWILSGVIIEE